MRVCVGQSAKIVFLISLIAVLGSLLILMSYYYYDSAFGSDDKDDQPNSDVNGSNQITSPLVTKPCVDHNCVSRRVAIINPTFTAAAYDSFYDFFRKHKDHSSTSGEAVITDLDKLSSTVPYKSGFSQQAAVDFLAQHLKGSKNNYDVTILSDADVDKGLIFSHSLP